MLDLSKMREFADGTRLVRRKPVKTHFTEEERRAIKSFFFSLCPPRDSSSMRMLSFFALSEILGKTLEASSYHRLENANIVGDFHFLVGRGTVKSGKDWQLKCLGLAEVEPKVFVVGLNQIFYDRADAYWVNRLRP